MFLFQTVDGHEPTRELIGYFDEHAIIPLIVLLQYRRRKISHGV